MCPQILGFKTTRDIYKRQAKVRFFTTMLF